MKKQIQILSLVITLSVIIFSCAKDEKGSSPNSEISYESLMKQYIKEFEIVKVNYDQAYQIALQKNANYTDLNLNFESHPDWTFKMKDDDMNKYQSPDCKTYEIKANNMVTEYNMHEVLAMEGYLNTSNNKVFMSFSLGKMEALLRIDEVEYTLEPLNHYDRKAPKDLYVLYKSTNFIMPSGSCGNEELSPIGQVGTSTRAVSNPWKVNFTYLGDYKFFQKFSTSTEAYDYMHWRFYYGNKRYNEYNNIGLNWVKRSAYLYTTANTKPNTTSSGTTFVQECSAFYGYSWYNKGDVNYFFTGHDVTGVWGQADGIQRMCSQPSKSFSFGEWKIGSTYYNNLIAHEVGHSMGCYHDNSSNNFMHPTWTSWNTTIGTNAKTNIVYALGYQSCLSK